MGHMEADKPQTPRSPRRNLKQMSRLMFGDFPILSKELFGPDNQSWPGNDGVGRPALVDFEMENYVYFLDNVPSPERLVEGLALLSPFADDALDVAEAMTLQDFAAFKLALPHERRIAAGDVVSSRMPERFAPLLLPEQFPLPMMITEKAATSLGVTILRTMETNLVADQPELL